MGVADGGCAITWWPHGGTFSTHLDGWYRMSQTVHCRPLLRKLKPLLQTAHVPEVVLLVSCARTSTLPRAPSMSSSWTLALTLASSSVSSCRS